MNRLKDLRKEKRLTQKELADEMGTTKLTVSNWENEKHVIKSDKAQTLADFFGVSVGYLLGYTDNPRQYADELVAEKEDGKFFINSITRNLEEVAAQDFLEYIWFFRDHEFYLSNDEIIASYNRLLKYSLNHGGNGFNFLKSLFKSPYSIIEEAEKSEEYSFIFSNEYERPALLEKIKGYIDAETCNDESSKRLLEVLEKEYGKRNYANF